MAKGCSQCLHCGTRLPIYLRLKEAGFCSPEHRDAFQREQQKLALERLIETEKILSQALASRLEKPLTQVDRAIRRIAGGPEQGALPEFNGEDLPLAGAVTDLPGRAGSTCSISCDPAPIWRFRAVVPEVASEFQAHRVETQCDAGVPPLAPVLGVSPPAPAEPSPVRPEGVLQPEFRWRAGVPSMVLPVRPHLPYAPPGLRAVPAVKMAWRGAGQAQKSAVTGGVRIVLLAFNGWSTLHRLVLAPYRFRSEHSNTRSNGRNRFFAGDVRVPPEARPALLRLAFRAVNDRRPRRVATRIEIPLKPALPVLPAKARLPRPAAAGPVRLPCRLKGRPYPEPVWHDSSLAESADRAIRTIPATCSPQREPVPPHPANRCEAGSKESWRARVTDSRAENTGPAAFDFHGYLAAAHLTTPAQLSNLFAKAPVHLAVPPAAPLRRLARPGISKPPAAFVLCRCGPVRTHIRAPAPVRLAAPAATGIRSIPLAACRRLPQPPAIRAEASGGCPGPQGLTRVAAGIIIPDVSLRPAAALLAFGPLRPLRSPVQDSDGTAGPPQKLFGRKFSRRRRIPIVPITGSAFHRLFRLVLVPPGHKSHIPDARSGPDQALPPSIPLPEAGVLRLAAVSPLSIDSRPPAPVLPEPPLWRLALPAIGLQRRRLSLKRGELRERSWRLADMSIVYPAESSLLEAEPGLLLPARRSRWVPMIPPVQALVDCEPPAGFIRPDAALQRYGPVAWPEGPAVRGPAFPIAVLVDRCSPGVQPDVSSLLEFDAGLQPCRPPARGPLSVADAPFVPIAPVPPFEWRPGALGPPVSDFVPHLGRRGLPTWSSGLLGRARGAGRWRRSAVAALPLAIIAVLLAGQWFAPKPANETVSKGLSKPDTTGLFESSMSSIRAGIAGRAGIQMVDDFRSGLDSWVGDGDGADSWRFDRTGFVQPARLAIYRPSLGMSNYTMEFLGEVDRKALSWVFRARDAHNYYAAKLMIVRPGPLPTIALRRWAVVGGRETARRDTVLPLTIRGTNVMFDVKLDANGPDFTLHIGGHQAEFWTDTRLATGGIGFFSSRGENSRIRWVRIEHQYDVLGRICAYLSPSFIASLNNRANGSWK